MNKQVKLSTSTVKNEKLQIESANVDIPFRSPELTSVCPMQHLVVKLQLTDGSVFERHFDFIPDCPIDKYIQITVSIFNQLQNASPDKTK